MKRQRSQRSKWVGRGVLLGLVGAAVVTELRKPKEERSWHGKLVGFVPYELRPPTLERVRDTYWSPEDVHVFKPAVWGVGWSVNVGRVMRLVRGDPGASAAIAA